MRRAFLLAAVLAALAAPAPALAGTVGVVNGVLTFTAGPGETNTVSFRQSFGGSGIFWYFDDTTASFTRGGPECWLTFDGKTICSWPGPLAIDTGDGNDSVHIISMGLRASERYTATVHLGDGNDTHTGEALPTSLGEPDFAGYDTVFGGSGNDTLNGGSTADTLYGEDGNDILNGDNHGDTLIGGAGTDTLNGGHGPDILQGGVGADTMNGGRDPGSPGGDIVGDNSRDLVDYSDHAGPVSVSIDGVANDGSAGENDILTEIEQIQGGSGNDTLSGGAGHDVIRGGPGNDTMSGGGNTDTLSYADHVVGVIAKLDGIANDGSPGETDAPAGDFEYIEGSPANDSLVGSGDFNRISGGEGNDSINGGGGNDELYGDGGQDIISGGAGNDTILGAVAGDFLFGDAGNDSIWGDGTPSGSGDDYIDGGAGADSLDGGHGNDQVYGGDGDDPWVSGYEGQDVVDGGAGNDLVDGWMGADVVSGGDGDDTVKGGPTDCCYDPDVVDGGAGNDTVTGGNDDDILRGGTGVDTLDGGLGIDTVTYSERATAVIVTLDDAANDGVAGENDNAKAVENAIGGFGADRLEGNAGNNLLDGGAGADLLIGHAGTDTVTYASRTNPVTVTLAGGADDGETGEGDNVGAAFGPSAAGNVENVIGGAGADTLTGSTVVNAVDGGPGNDQLFGGDANDVLHGNDGDDVLDGQGGADLHAGDAGLDTASYATRMSGVTVTLDDTANDGSPGENDQSFVENITGGSGNDTLTGIGAPNPQYTFGGPNPNNVLIGGGGNDVLDGGLVPCGNFSAWYCTISGADTLIGGDGTDTASYTARTEALTLTLDGVANDGAPAEGDNVSPDIEVLTGGSGNDTLVANAGIDVLNGGDGNDTLNGGPGNVLANPDSDILNGGGGVDTADYSARSQFLSLSLDGVANDGHGHFGVGLELDLIGADVENATGGSNSDTLTGDAGPNRLDGGAGLDTLRGFDGNDTLLGGSGDIDTLFGGPGNDTLDGGIGIADRADYFDHAGSVFVNLGDALPDGSLGEADVLTNLEAVSGTAVRDVLTGDGGDNFLTGNGGNDELAGAGGNDRLFGNDGIDALDGGPGNDTLMGGALADILDGSSGIDTADYSDHSFGVVVNLGDPGGDGSPGENDALTGIENLKGGDGADTLTGNEGANTLSGEPGPDTLRGGLSNDVLQGGPGDDILIGGEGNDSFDGGSESDLVSYSDQVEPVVIDLIEGKGSGVKAGLDTWLAVERFAGGSGDDQLQGNAIENILDGGPGNDTIVGDAAFDILQGGPGNDRFDESKGPGEDELHGGAGSDTVDYTGRTDNITVDLTDTVDDKDGREIFPDVDVENIVGGLGADTLLGNAAGNLLDGGPGADLIAGLGGIDTVLYSSRTKAVDVTLDGVQNDGQADEDRSPGLQFDNVATDVENVVGGNDGDTIVGSAQPNRLDGGPGKDTVNGGDGADVLLGGSLPDARDDLTGGPGIDTADYSARTGVVHLTLDGVANDGATGEEDNVDAENLVGGSGADALTGDANANTLTGGPGADSLDCGGGTDLAVADALDTVVGCASISNPPPTVSVADVAVTEGDEGATTAAFTVRLSAPSGKTAKVFYRTREGTAAGGSDFTHVDGSLTFSPGGALEQTVTVEVLGDTTFEADEAFILQILEPEGVDLGDDEGTATILNDDALPAISIADLSIVEGNAGTADAVFTATLSNPSSQTVQVSYATADAGAAAPGDYTAVAGSISFAPGATTQTVHVPISGELDYELAESFRVNLSAPVNGVLADFQATGAIPNDDAKPTISVADVTVAETNANAPMDVVISLNAASYETITVNYATSNGTAVTSPDYFSATGTLTFAPGETTKAAPVTIRGDQVDEFDETFNVALTLPTNATIADGAGVATITDNDPEPVLTVNDKALAEGGTLATTFRITLTGQTAKPVTVNYSTADVTASAPADYTAVTGSVTFAPGETFKNIAITGKEDALDEVDETFVYNLSDPVNATIGDGQGVATITDNDAPPAISITDVTVTEPASPTGTANATFTVSLSGASGRTITVNYATADGTAIQPGDYASASSTLTFNPGETEKTLDVVVKGDALVESNETFFVNLSAPANATIADAQGVGTIPSNVPQPTLSISDAAALEGAPRTTNTATPTITLSPASAEEVRVDVRTFNGSAVQPDDYANKKEQVVFAPGETSKPWPVTIAGDGFDEQHETFTVDLSSAEHAIVGDGIGVITIEDDDPEPTLSIGDVIVLEGQETNPQAILTVVLSAASAKLVKINYAAADETANGEDYRVSPGTLFFEPGDVEQTIAVDIHADLVEEPNEVFTVSLSKPSNATIADGLAVVTIANDDFSVHTLEVKKLGAGDGLVKSDPEGIHCGDDCSETYETGAKVYLYASPAAGSVFTGWNGGGCSGTGDCKIALNDSYKVEATFETDTRPLLVTLAGNGAGTVVSAPDGIDCGADCEEAFPAGSTVELTPKPALGSTFAGWTGGACKGLDPCLVTMDQAQSAEATFELDRHGLKVSRAGSGGGSVSGPGIACPSDCEEELDYGTEVTLTAAPNGDSLFAGWSGDCTGTDNCVLTIGGDRSATATFTAKKFPLAVAAVGSGAGTVASDPNGIACGADCSEAFDAGALVTLAATPSAGSAFVGWSGDCAGAGACTVTMSDARSVTATFADTAAPETTITSGPSGPTNDTTPSFAFTSNDAGSSFECRVDAAAFAACTTPFTSVALAEGAHTFDVRAVDSVGNVDATPATRSFTVDTAAPDTMIASGPTGPTNDTTPSFAFTSNEAGANFQCRVDAAAFAACTTPFTSAAQAEGAHTFDVRAIDGAGNVDPTHATRSFTVDTTAPDTTISSGPPALTNDTTPAFAFTSELGAGLECRMDAAAFAACTSPLTTTALAFGAHTFQVRATDAAGNVDPTPASRAFSVVPKSTLSIRTSSVKLKPGRIAPIEIRCGPQGRCKGTLVLDVVVKRQKVKLGSRAFDIAAGKTVTVKVTLTKKGLELVVDARSLKVQAHASCKQVEGADTTATRAVTLRAP